MSRMNFAPRLPTIIVALALVVVGMLGTFGGMLPTVAGIDSVTIGVWAYLASFGVLVAGIVFKGV